MLRRKALYIGKVTADFFIFEVSAIIVYKIISPITTKR